MIEIGAMVPSYLCVREVVVSWEVWFGQRVQICSAMFSQFWGLISVF